MQSAISALPPVNIFLEYKTVLAIMRVNKMFLFICMYLWLYTSTIQCNEKMSVSDKWEKLH